MAETKNIENVILESLAAWRSNLILGLPFFLNMMVSVFLIVAYAAFVYFFANPFGNIITGDFFSVLRSVDWALLILDLLLALAVFILMIILSAFFMSGAIGMANNALTKGETSVGDLFHYGRKHFIKVLLANIFILIIMMIIIFIALILQLILNGEYVNITTLILGMLFAPVPYAIVISNCGVRKGLKKGTAVAWNNELDTILIYCFVTFLTSLVTLLAFAATGLICALIIALIPLSELTWVAIKSAVLAAAPAIAGGLIIAVIIYMAALILVAEPIVAVCWSNYYLNKKENE